MIYTVCIRADLFVEVSAENEEEATDVAVAAVDDQDTPVMVENDPAALPLGILHARVWPWRSVLGQPEVISVEKTRDDNEEEET